MKRMFLAVAAVLVGALALASPASEVLLPTYGASSAAGQDKAEPDAFRSIVTGRVVDLKGQPIAGAEVYCINSDDSRENEPKIAHVASGDDGRFSLKLPYTLPADMGTTTYWFAIADGCAFGYPDLSNPKTKELTLICGPECKIAGKLVDEKGKPVAGAKLEIGFSGSRESRKVMVAVPSGPWLNTTSGPDGSFVIRHALAPKSLEEVGASVTISGQGRASISAYLNRDHLLKDARLVSPSASVLEGTLKLPDGHGAAPEGVEVCIGVDGPIEWAGNHSCRTDKSGKFRFLDLPSGKAYLWLPQPSGDDAPSLRPFVLRAVEDIQLTTGAIRKMEFQLQTGALLSGSVVDAHTGKPVPKANIWIEHKGSQGQDSVTTDSQGKYTARVAAGDVEVSLDSASGEWCSDADGVQKTVTVKDGEQKAGVDFKFDAYMSEPDSDRMENETPEDFALGPGAYKLTWAPDLYCGDESTHEPFVEGSAAKSLVKRAPQFASQKVVYTAFKLDSLGDGLILTALDESKGAGKGYDTLYIDANRDRDLTNDKPCYGTNMQNGSYESLRSDWTSVYSRQGSDTGRRTDNPVQVRVSCYLNSEGSVEELLERKGAWKGVLESNKGPVECILVDGNHDGRYCDRPIPASDDKSEDDPGDIIYIDTNGYGRAVIASDSPHASALYPVCVIGTNYCCIEANAAGETLTVAPYAGPTGLLSVLLKANELVAETKSFCIEGPQAHIAFDVEEGKPERVPVGSYKLNECTATFTSKDGDKLDLEMTGDAVVEIKVAQAVALWITGPISAAIEPDNDGVMEMPAGARWGFAWEVKIGDKVKLTKLGDGSDEKFLPKVEFLDKTGKVLATGTAGYT